MYIHFFNLTGVEYEVEYIVKSRFSLNSLKVLQYVPTKGKLIVLPILKFAYSITHHGSIEAMC